ncbi:MAG TPA: hypothetical protein VEK34_09910 [Methylocella sp.]|nr:hypothetical protein [Methylocella sp.]
MPLNDADGQNRLLLAQGRGRTLEWPTGFLANMAVRRVFLRVMTRWRVITCFR